jgi:DNA topoisomerase IA
MVDTNKYSVGRVQTPTLAMVVDRYAIENFKPQPYWEYRLYIEILLVMKKVVFKKEDGTLSKVKESDFEIVSIEKKKVNMHQSYLI